MEDSQFEQFYKWRTNDDICCARVINGTTADYYKNGKLYAEYQKFILKETDIKINRREFKEMIGL
jgi:hypothetical protein